MYGRAVEAVHRRNRGTQPHHAVSPKLLTCGEHGAAQVEQERFVVKPFTLGLHSSPVHDDHVTADDTMEASDKLLNRSTTGLIRGCAAAGIPRL